MHPVCRAVCFGGDTLTATDVAVVLGHMELGDKGAVAARVSVADAEEIWEGIQEELDECIERAKTHSGKVDVMVVGGGGGLCGDALRGASRIIRPPHAHIANAAGAAVLRVGGSIDGVFALGSSAAQRQVALQQLERAALEKAVGAGATESSCKVSAPSIWGFGRWRVQCTCARGPQPSWPPSVLGKPGTPCNCIIICGACTA